jgi:hypothetical protein
MEIGGDLGQHKRALTLLDDDVERLEALAEDADEPKGDRGQQSWTKQLAKQVSIEETHSGRSC